MNEDSLEKIIDATVKEFIGTTDKIIDIYHQIGGQVKFKDDLSQVLLLIREIFLRDIYPGCQILADKKMFVSLCILCRSMLDITSQMKWIISLDQIKQQKAIDCFIKFDGVAKTPKGRPIYQWQQMIDPAYSEREAAKLLGDTEIVDFNIKKIIRVIGNRDFEEVENIETISLTIFDYLSKIIHWNPAILKRLVGISNDKKMGYQEGEHLRAAIISMATIIHCTVIFTEIFCGHFFEDKRDNDMNRLRKLGTAFECFIIELSKSKEIS